MPTEVPPTEVSPTDVSQNFWLSTSEQVAWRAVLEMFVETLSKLSSDLSPHGITLEDYEILVHLSEAPQGRLRMSELAVLSMLSKSRLTYRIDRLAEREYVERSVDRRDRRGLYASLTEGGQHFIEAVAPSHVRSVRARLTDRLNPAEFLELGRLAQLVISDP